MFLESFLILGVIGIILTFFYRQAIKEFRILQTEDLEKAQGLIHERSPIVVLPSPTPQQLWTRKDIQQRPTLGSLALNGALLNDHLKSESVILRPETGNMLAERIGLPVWVKQTLLPYFKQSQWWTSILWATTEATIGAQGLRQTYAYSTILIATEGALAVSLLNESSDAYLPVQWLGKRVSKLTRDDAPLLGQIEYIDVIVRPGSALLIPAHWKVCWENYEMPKPALAVWIEIHHPLSHFVAAAAKRRLK